MERLRAEVETHRADIAGRAMPPTDAEIEVHAAVGGRWLYRTAGVAPYSQETMRRPFALAEACRLEGNVGRWWALDASGAPCAWPVMTPARAKPCECSAAHADEYVAVCDKSCDCLCHE